MADATEYEKLLDHDYDGIREYDNPLPGWWVWIFILSFLLAFPYIGWYHWGIGPSLEDNLDAEVAAYAEQLLATYGDLQPDEATILSFMDDSVAMTGMAGLFKGKCAQCHTADGSGNVGANLTDDYWINVKTVADIPNILNDGVIAKGMPAWGDRLTQTQIVLLSSYVASLRAKPLEGKAPQGDLIPPWPKAPAAEAPAAEAPAAEAPAGE